MCIHWKQGKTKKSKWIWVDCKAFDNEYMEDFFNGYYGFELYIQIDRLPWMKPIDFLLYEVICIFS